MIKGILQTDKRLLKVINDYGCLFLCFAQCSKTVFQGTKGCEKLNMLWLTAVDKGIITSDLNNDGDYDDAGEAEVQNHTALAKLFDLNVRYDGKHHDKDELIPTKVKFLFGRFKWKSGHFVVLNKNKEVTYDPLGKSLTVQNGFLENTRWYYAD